MQRVSRAHFGLAWCLFVLAWIEVWSENSRLGLIIILNLYQTYYILHIICLRPYYILWSQTYYKFPCCRQYPELNTIRLEKSVIVAIVVKIICDLRVNRCDDLVWTNHTCYSIRDMPGGVLLFHPRCMLCWAVVSYAMRIHASLGPQVMCGTQAPRHDMSGSAGTNRNK